MDFHSGEGRGFDSRGGGDGGGLVEASDPGGSTITLLWVGIPPTARGKIRF